MLASRMGRAVIWGVLWCFSATTVWTLPPLPAAWAQTQPEAIAADALPPPAAEAAAPPQSEATTGGASDPQPPEMKALPSDEEVSGATAAPEDAPAPPAAEPDTKTRAKHKLFPSTKPQVNSRRKKKHERNELKKEDNLIDRLFTVGPKKEKERFDLDYAPSDKPIIQKDGDDKPATPFYKHWLFWTVIGAAAFTGTILGIKYGVDHRDSMSLEVTRR